MKKIPLIFILLLSLLSCNTDDDICTTAEGTPRMKIKFKTQSTGKLKSLDTLLISVDYGNGPITILQKYTKTDSTYLPLRVEDNGYTDVYINNSKKGTPAKIRINYTPIKEYVSPACGIKLLYQNLNPTLVTPSNVIGLEKSQTEIINENKTHLYLLF